VFRNTLKKMQGRWAGQMAGISGQAAYTNNPLHVLKGELTNKSGYDLQGVDVIVYIPQLIHSPDPFGSSYLYHLGRSWKKGEKVDLEKALSFDYFTKPTPNFNFRPATVEQALEVIGWKKSQQPMARGLGGMGGSEVESAFRDDPQMSAVNSRSGWGDDLLYLLLDARNVDGLQYYDRREPVRGVGRLTDCTKALHAAGALIVAHAGDVTEKEFVKSPVPLTVNGKVVEGKGEILFAWALPVEGDAPTNMQLQLAPSGEVVPAGTAALEQNTLGIEPLKK